MPWYAKVYSGLVVASTFSPINLVPDFITVLGYQDDLILVLLGIALVVKMIPSEVMWAYRAQADIDSRPEKPTNWVAELVIIAIWLTLTALAIVWRMKLVD